MLIAVAIERSNFGKIAAGHSPHLGADRVGGWPGEGAIALTLREPEALVDRPAGRVVVLPGAPIAPARRARDEEGTLMTALREWRLVTSRSDGVPAYVVAPDSLLLEIADQRPRTTAALRRVKGMGPSRLARYGEEILAITATDP